MVVPAANLAVIDASACIGCMLCIPACPTLAIDGEAKQPHTVVTANCTGCGLCLPVCPVECIVMRPQYAATNTQRGAALPQAMQDKITAARARARARHG